MKVLVIGATGNLGGEVVRTALAAGHAVTALARDPSAIAIEDPNLQLTRGDVRDPASLQQATEAQDAVISCLGTKDRTEGTLRTDGARNTIAAMRLNGVRRLIVFSAFGAGDSREHLKRDAPIFGRLVVPLLLKAAFEDMGRMEDEVRASGLDWTIVRPSALTKKHATGAVNAVVDESAKVGANIPYADVAGFMVEQLASDRFLGMAPAISA
ncbi:MAG TPA: SDR family oxidoreductase [Solirubrobacteraceae bacterium]|nr:SDR family oxidoreductase [Solirubrobacteraceae bacterium]